MEFNKKGFDMKTDIITETQRQLQFYKTMLKTLERKKKKTPGNGFAKIMCKEKIEECEKFLDRVDFMAQVVYD